MGEVAEVPRAILGKLLVDLADSVPYRQSTRLPVVLPIKITGKDKVGRPFEELTQTIDVSKQGIKTSIFHQLAMDTPVAVSPIAAGKDCRARVVWQTQNHSGEERTEVGVEFIESLLPKSMWALGSVPEDWLDGQLDLTVSQKLEYFWARMKNFPVSSELKAMVGSTESLLETLGDLPPSGPDSEGADSLPPANIPNATTEDKGNNSEAQPGTELDPGRTTDKSMPVAAAPPQDSGPKESNLAKTAQGRPLPASGIGSHSDQAQKNFPDPNRLAANQGEQAEMISKGIDRSLNPRHVVAQDASDSLRGEQKEIETDLHEIRSKNENRPAEHGDSNDLEYHQQTEASLSHLGDKVRQMEVQIEKLKSEFGRQINEEGASNEKENREVAAGLIEEFRSELGQALNEFRAAIAEEAQVQLRRGSASLREISASEQREIQLKSAALKQGPESMGADSSFMRSARDLSQSHRSPTGAVTILALIMAIATVVCAFAFISTQPTWQLQAVPPAEFLNTNSNGSLQPDEEALARAYWNCAAQVIQKTYSFGRALPADPPPEFAIQPPGAVRIHSKASWDASRAAYWQKLRQVWSNPQVWEETYQWNTDWVLSPLRALGLKLRR